MKTNVIPRHFAKIRFTALKGNSAGVAGDEFWLYAKNEDGRYLVENIRTGRFYQANLPMLRTPELTRIEEIVA